MSIENTRILRKQLLEKAYKEQENYIEHLKTLPPEQIINRAYEKTKRDDILMVFESAYISDEQLAELAKLDSPVDACYQGWLKNDYSDVEPLRDTVAEFADELTKRKTKADLIRCCKEITTTINDNFDGMHLNPDGAKQIVSTFEPECISQVLATSIRNREFDRRISRENIAWAKEIIPDVVILYHGTKDYCVNSHPAVLNGFINQVRSELEKYVSNDKDSIVDKAEADEPDICDD